MNEEVLKLENQICFPFYALSRVIIRAYQPHLDQLGLTYTQYLVMLVLWEEDGISVNDIAEKLILNTNTVTPLLKRMEKIGFLSRIRGEKDERKVFIKLTLEGQKLRENAAAIPLKLLEAMNQDESTLRQLVDMRDTIRELLPV